MKDLFYTSITNAKRHARYTVEYALNKHLPGKHPIHHVDKDIFNNRCDNLVVCENHTYHKLLHARTEAYKACGNPKWRKCKRCGSYDDPANLIIENDNHYFHKACEKKYRHDLYLRKKQVA